MNQKGFAPILIVLGIILLLGIAGGAYYFGQSSVKLPTSVSQVPVPTSQTSVSPTQSPVKTNITSPSPIVIQNTSTGLCQISTYTNDTYKYSIAYYPNYWGNPIKNTDGKGVTFAKKEVNLSELATSSVTYMDIQHWSNTATSGSGNRITREAIINSTSANPGFTRSEIQLGDKSATKVFYQYIMEQEHSSSFNSNYSGPKKTYDITTIYTPEDKDYNMIVLTYSHPHGESTACTLDEILSTFKFLN